VEVRRNAALVMANIGGAASAPAVPVLVEALQDGDLDTRRQVAAAFRNIGPTARAALDPLRQALKDRDAVLRANVALGLGGLADAGGGAVPALVARVGARAEKEEVRFIAAGALSAIGSNPAALDAIPTLVRVIDDRTAPAKVRERTLWALRPHGKKLE